MLIKGADDVLILNYLPGLTALMARQYITSTNKFEAVRMKALAHRHRPD